MNVYEQSTWSLKNDYATSYKFDPNGNITDLVRNAHGLQGGTEIDNLDYDYELETNKLLKVIDNYKGDLNGTMDDISGIVTYEYDALGNLKFSQTIIEGETFPSEILIIEWNLQGKIKSILNEVDFNLIEYTYDALGNRIRKDVSSDMEDPNTKLSTFYVRDA